MYKRILSIALLFVFANSFASAWSQNQSSLRPVVFSSDLQIPTAKWTAKGFVLVQGMPALVKGLWQVREYQRKSQWEKCLQKNEGLKKMAPSLRPWLAKVEIQCAMSLATQSQRANYRRLTEAIRFVDKNDQWLLQGPQVRELQQLYVQGLLVLAEKELKINRRQAWKAIDQVLLKRHWLNSSQEAQVYRLAGELSFIQQNLTLALEYFSRSVQAQPSAELSQRLDSIRKTIAQTPTKSPPPEVKTKPSTSSSLAAGPATDGRSGAELEVSEKENELYQRIKVALKSGELLAGIEDSVKLIREFPGSRRADWAGDRVLDILDNLVANTDSKYRLLKQRIMAQLEKVDGDRQADWAKTLFNRGYYLESLSLAEASVPQLSGKNLASPLNVAAQSAVFLGDYKKAESYFIRLINEHGGTDLAIEGLFRLGLLQLRLQKYSSAVATFERVLALPQGSRYELSSRYWLWRALEKSNSDRAILEAKELIDRFPLTYYGLRARAEGNNRRLTFSPDGKGPVKIEAWLTESESQAWERFQILLKAGWFKEAQAEIGELPPAQSPEEKVVRARLLDLAFDHYGAITMINEAWSQDRELIRPALYFLAFPREFSELVGKYGGKQGINTALVMGLIKQESSFQPEAVSPANAAGLMQIVPGTARDSAQYLNYKKKLSLPEDLFDPDLNIYFGTSYLRRMVRAFDGHLPLALGSYNLGIGRLRKWLSNREELQSLSQRGSANPFDDLWMDELPWAETSFYVKAVLRNYLIYRTLDGKTLDLSQSFWAGAIE